MELNFKAVETGDEVYILIPAIRRIWGHELSMDIENQPDFTSVKFLAMANNSGTIYLMNPDVGCFPIEHLQQDEIAYIKRGDDLIYPKAYITPSERAFLTGLKPILKKDTTVIKVAVTGGIFEYLKLINVKTLTNKVEVVDFPCFMKDAYYKGLTPQKEYTLDDLGIAVEEE